MATIHFLNVGSGACSIIQHDDGKVTMISQCGAFVPEEETSDGKGSSEHTNPYEYLKLIGVDSIFRFILTHPEMDHMDYRALRRTSRYTISGIQKMRRR